jgi:hypothetical protein
MMSVYKGNARYYYYRADRVKMEYSSLNKRPDFRICNNMEKGRKISISRGRKRGGKERRWVGGGGRDQR